MKSAVDETVIQKHLAQRAIESSAKQGSLFAKNPSQPIESTANASSVRRRALRPTNQGSILGTPKLQVPNSTSKLALNLTCGDNQKLAHGEKSGSGFIKPSASGGKLSHQGTFSLAGSSSDFKKPEEVDECSCSGLAEKASNRCVETLANKVGKLESTVAGISNEKPNDLHEEREDDEDSDIEIEHGPPSSYYLADVDASESYLSSTSVGLNSHTSVMPNLSMASAVQPNQPAAFDTWNAAQFEDGSLDEMRPSDFVKVLIEQFAVHRVPGDGGYVSAFGESSKPCQTHGDRNWRWHLFETAQSRPSSAEEARKAPFRSWDLNENPLVARELESYRKCGNNNDSGLGFLADTEDDNDTASFAIGTTDDDSLAEMFGLASYGNDVGRLLADEDKDEIGCDC